MTSSSASKCRWRTSGSASLPWSQPVARGSTQMTFSGGQRSVILLAFTLCAQGAPYARAYPLGPVRVRAGTQVGQSAQVPVRVIGAAKRVPSAWHSALRAICSWISRCSPRSLMSGSSLPSRRMFTAGSGSRGSPSSTTLRRQASGGSSSITRRARAAKWSCTPGVGSAGI